MTHFEVERLFHFGMRLFCYQNSQKERKDMPKSIQRSYKVKELQITEVPIEKIKEADYNPRFLSEKAEADLTKSLEIYGCVEPLVINTYPGREFILVGGHQRLKILKKLGYKSAPTVNVHLPLDAEQRLNLRLNRNVGEFDLSLLRNFEIDVLLETGFDDTDLSLIWDDALETEEDGFDLEKALVEHKQPKTKTGDFIKLGNHYLLCGDATKLEDVQRLVGERRIDIAYCDSPYNISLDYNKGIGTSGKYGATKTKDSKSVEEYKAFLQQSMSNAIAVAKPDAHFFYYCDQNWIWLVQQLYQELGIKHERVCLWLKNNANVVPQVAFNKVYEPVVYGTRGKPYLSSTVANLNEVLNKEVGTGNRLSDDVLDLFCIWLAKRDASLNYEHPTQKPIALHEKPLRRCTKPGDLVLDTFGGSGSTLIACEQMRRRAFLLEIDPVFCDVIINRWQTLTGKEVEYVS